MRGKAQRVARVAQTRLQKTEVTYFLIYFLSYMLRGGSVVGHWTCD